MPSDLVPLTIVLTALLAAVLVFLFTRRASLRLTPASPSRRKRRRRQ